MTLTLYYSTICPYAQRARLAVREAGIDVDEVGIDLRNKPEWYTRDINPAGKVPALKLDDGEILVESLVIAQYILEKHDASSRLIPEDPLTRARIRLWIERLGSFIPSIYGVIKAEEGGEQQARDNFLAAARQLNTELERVSGEGPYIFGDQFTLADIVSAPHLVSLETLERYNGFTIPDTREYARLNALRKTLRERPSVQQILPSYDEMVASYERLRARYAAAK
ncbi:glutathione S-transferase [Syncephalis pseudoplumigaleata]|uniref:Glutathione S-transferase n=1 Tax=Syncephalis pseudoplumigaleata TaxID=1712513 RepID=A0A4P9YY35_9FUNG|nr:glutathione S-transferase [Syncephalis pseudoplumigaleata]|eukprot:RKP24954.1 glutathione S-transferase [Syncephalis pseudoplumigaleata]